MAPETASGPAARRLAVIVKGYPRLSETFIAQEILGLQDRGLDQLIVSLRHPTDPAIHPVHRRIRADVLYLPEYLHDDPARVAAARDWARTQPGYARAYAVFRRDLTRDRSHNRWRRFGQACVLARELPDDIGWLHVHYLHTPAAVARYAAIIRGLPWTASAHAKDIWTTEAWELREKLADADWVVTCTEVNRTFLAGLAPSADRVELVYHGLDLARFPAGTRRPDRDGSRADDPVRLLSVGRAVEKKGLDLLLSALARLPATQHWSLTHIGGGELLNDLKSQADALNLADRIDWRGAQDQDDVIAAYLAADLFVLPCRIAASGDRDGLPNVLMEAQACGLACLSTTVSAIPELIRDGETGLLVPPEDLDALTGALGDLISNPERRQTLAKAGEACVRGDFGMTAGLDRVYAKLQGALSRTRQRRAG